MAQAIGLADRCVDRVFTGASIGAAEDISKARRDIDGITKKLNDLDAWFSDATRRQRDLQKELRSTRSIDRRNQRRHSPDRGGTETHRN